MCACTNCYVCIDVCTYVCAYVRMYIHMCMHVRTYVRTLVEQLHSRTHPCVLVLQCTNTWLHTYVRMYLLHVCMYLSPRVYMFVHTADHEINDLPPLLFSLCPLLSPASLPLYVHTYVPFLLLCRGYMCCWSMKGSLNTS